MTMPRRLTLLRHGQSEANVVQKELLPDLDSETVAEIYARPDWAQRLSPLGVEQATNAGDWIRKNIGMLASYSVIYVSNYIRTFETAAYAAGDEDVRLVPEDRIIERDWGLYGKLSKADQAKFYPETYRYKKDNPLYARLDGGESPMDVYARIRDMHGTLHREFGGNNSKVLMVTHGDLMSTERYVNERMLPEEWMEMVRDPWLDFRNCTVLDYRRDNPVDPDDVRDKLNWMRMVHTTCPDLSPYDGNWVEMKGRRTYSVKEGLARVARSGQLLSPDVLDKLREVESAKLENDRKRFDRALANEVSPDDSDGQLERREP